MDHGLAQAARIQRLCKLAKEVRQIAIDRQGDVEGWCVARLLREAITPAEADEAERRFELWAVSR